MRKFLLAAAGGFVAGYSAVRFIQSARLRHPIAKRQPDAAAYGATRRALALAAIARSLSASAALAYGPLSDALERSVRKLPAWLAPVAFSLEAFACETIAELPIDYIEGHALEHRYGLSDQSPSSWLTDHVKQGAISAAVTSVLTGLFAAVLRRFPFAWPYVAGIAALPLLVLANVLVPLYIMPLFNEYKPIEGPLEQRLRALAARYGVGDAEILRMDMSKQTRKANAFVTGIARTHRIVVGDTLIDHFPPEEIEFVVAHELGHYVAKDSWRLIAAGEVLAVAMFFTSALAIGRRDRSATAQPATIARIQWWSVLFSQALRPAISAYMRSREWAADRFALAAVGAGENGVAAFRRLRQQNLAEEEQPAWFEWWFSTHPSLKARIAALAAD